jgi:NADPH-dependent curcumin reductase CurA
VDTRQVPLPVYLGGLGMPGMTAYFGLLDIGRPQPGQTVVVSGAAGAVGGIVGQLAKLKECRAIGIAGGAEKCRYVVDELGFDAAIDYKAGNIEAMLAEHCPQGIDVYFDNVGGEILDAALAQLARHARVIICGAISQYNATAAMQGPSNYLSLLVNHATMTGFVVSDYGERYAEGAKEMAEWVAAGKLTTREEVLEGLERFPDALLRLFEGGNTGKLVLKVG